MLIVGCMDLVNKELRRAGGSSEMRVHTVHVKNPGGGQLYLMRSAGMCGFHSAGIQSSVLFQDKQMTGVTLTGPPLEDRKSMLENKHTLSDN